MKIKIESLDYKIIPVDDPLDLPGFGRIDNEPTPSFFSDTMIALRFHQMRVLHELKQAKRIRRRLTFGQMFAACSYFLLFLASFRYPEILPMWLIFLLMFIQAIFMTLLETTKNIFNRRFDGLHNDVL